MLGRLQRMGALTRCGPDDQRGFHKFFLENPELCALDYRGELFATLHFLTKPMHVHPGGHVLVGRAPSRDESLALADGAGEAEGGGGRGGKAQLPREAWARVPCAVHGNGGDGKSAYARLVRGWAEATEGGARAEGGRSSVRVDPPSFSAGIALYTQGDLQGAETHFRVAMVRSAHTRTPSHTRRLAHTRTDIGHTKHTR